jgi:predicted nucleic-acid-binding protein
MTGLDTNVLVRYLTQDDAKQAAQATVLIDTRLTAAKSGFISLVVLTELYWVLSNAYAVKPAEWLLAVDDLLASQRLHVEQRDVVRSAAAACREGKAGFVDALIAQVALAAGCGQPLTFDKLAVRWAGMAAV